VSTGVDDPARPPSADEPGGTPVTDAAPPVTIGDLRESPARRRGVFRSLGPVVGPWVELVVVVALAFAAAYLVQWFIVKPYRIPSESMENTLMVGDRVLVARFWYRFSDVERGQIIVFHPPGRGDEVIDKASTPANDLNFIKRVVGLPGDRVSCCDVKGRVFVNGTPIDEPYVTKNANKDSPKTPGQCGPRQFDEVVHTDSVRFLKLIERAEQKPAKP